MILNIGLRIFLQDVEKTQWFEDANIDDSITGTEVSLLKSKANAVEMTFSSGMYRLFLFLNQHSQAGYHADGWLTTL